MTYLTPNIQDTTISTCDQIQKILSILHSSLRIKSSQCVVCSHLADLVEQEFLLEKSVNSKTSHLELSREEERKKGWTGEGFMGHG